MHGNMYTWTSPVWETHSYIVVDMKWHSVMPDVRSFRELPVTGHYLIVAKVIERLAISKHAAQKFNGERINLRKLNELEVGKHQIATAKTCSFGNTIRGVVSKFYGLMT